MADLLLGVVGWPLTRTLSPPVHEAFMRACGIRGSYTVDPVRPDGLPAALRRLHSAGYAGLNVTVPHKTRAAGLCAGLSAEAAEIGAVNTLARLGNGWFGSNTDSPGFLRLVTRLGLCGPFLVVGSGGAARAVLHALRLLRADWTQFSRREGAGEPLDTLEARLGDAGEGTLVNATPLGWGDSDPFPAGAGAAAGWVFVDLNYNSSWRFRRDLEEAGARVVGGEELLVEQAALSFKAWTGVEPPPGAARAALGGASDGLRGTT